LEQSASPETARPKKRLEASIDHNSLKSKSQVTKYSLDELDMLVTKSPKEISSLTERIDVNLRSREEHTQKRGRTQILLDLRSHEESNDFLWWKCSSHVIEQIKARKIDSNNLESKKTTREQNRSNKNTPQS